MTLAAVLAGMQSGSAGLKTKRAIVALAVATLVVLLVSVLERAASPVGAGDRALGATFRFVVPILTLVWSGLTTGPINLREAAWPVSRFGHPRAAVALGIVLASALAAAASAVLLAVMALVCARAGADAGPSALSLPMDLVVSSGIAVLAGLGYASWFGLAATFGARGGGRIAFLFVDLFLGGVGFAGAVLPRGGVFHLLGGEAPLDLPQRATSAILILVTGVCLALGFVRSRD